MEIFMAKRYSQDEIIARIEDAHPKKYGFDRFIFTKLVDKSWLKCPTHGYFEISPHKAINGRGCRKCSDKEKGDKFRRDLTSFIKAARLVHGNQYKYRGFTEIINNNTPIAMFCRACNKIVPQRVNEHLAGKNHRGCVKIAPKPKKEKVKKPAAKILSELQSHNKKNMKPWEYSPDWTENDLTDGGYVGFIYVFKFPDGSAYIGSKQMYKKVKDVKKLKGDSVENGWREYSSSSKIVNQKIADGDEYTRTILWGFPTMAETLFVESYLIFLHGLDYNLLNKAVLNKTIFPSDKGRMRGIIQTIEGWL